MKREEQIRLGASAKYGNINCRAAEHFMSGAEWADKNPDADLAWKLYNFVCDYKNGKFGEVTLQQAIDENYE